MNQLTLLLLRTGQTLIAQTSQLEHEPRCHMFQPYLVGGKTKLTLTRWPEYTDEEHILLHTDSLLTVCDPSEAVRDKYLEKIGKTLEDFTPREEPVLLTEDEEFDSSIEEYEPDYIEE